MSISPEGYRHEGYVDASIYPPRLCLLQRHNHLDNGIRNDDSLSIHRRTDELLAG